MDVADFDYVLPPELIAQHGIEPRDAARLLVVGCTAGEAQHQVVNNLPRLLRRGDLLVLNRTRVFPARLHAKTVSGGKREVLLVHPDAEQSQAWRVMIRGRVQEGQTLDVYGVATQVSACHPDGERTLQFPQGIDVLALAERHGSIPLPPYIRRAADAHDRSRYQTVFADRVGSVAAPTASLHLTSELLDRLRAQGVGVAFVELRVGPGTFKPVDTERVEDFRIHAEWGSCPAETVAQINATRTAGGRVIAVGTTVVRVLESAALQSGEITSWQGWTSIFLHPPQHITTVDGLLTNFHLPRSSLLMLVACLTGVSRLHELYRTAIDARYRFFSYGDAMLLLPE